MENKLEKLLACPKCKNKKLKITRDKIKCDRCKSKYFIENGIPVFLNNKVESAHDVEGSFRRKIIRKAPKIYPLFDKIHRIIGPPTSSRIKEKKIKGVKMNITLLKQMKKNQTRLNIGSSAERPYENTINLDIGLFKGVDVVADGKKLPFKDNSFDLVMIESVLEHIDEPEKIIEESARVLKKGGKLHISIPFVFVFHGSPNDFNRYTLVGLMKRMKNNNFKIIDAGVLSGAGSTMSQIMRYYLALLFSFNNDFLFSVMLNVFGWLTFPLKYTDILLNEYKKSHMLSNIVYATGVKK